MNARLIEIDRITGLAILLVVIGHVVAREAPPGAEWYVLIKYLIYKFHMPLFMFCSGVIFQYTYCKATSARDLIAWVQKKAIRLAPGFLLVGTAILIGKLLASRIIYVDNVPTGFMNGFAQLIFYPKQSAAGSLWYIYALFILYTLVPLAYFVLKISPHVALLLALGMHIVSILYVIPSIFMLDAIFEYALFFQLGAIVSLYYESVIYLTQKNRGILVAVFLFSFLSLLAIDDEKVSKTIIGLASIPAVLALSTDVLTRTDGLLLTVASSSYTVYLFNTICIGVVKGAMLEVFPWDGANFLIFFIVLAVSGTALPILVDRLILVKVPTIRRYFV